MTKAPIRCPNCDSIFSVERKNEGRRAKCPSCKQPFVIIFEVDAPPVPPVVGQVDPEPRPAKLPATSRSNILPWALIPVAALVTLVLGYFVGRAHVKYQMRSALSQAHEKFAEALGQNFEPATVAPEPEPVVPVPQPIQELDLLDAPTEPTETEVEPEPMQELEQAVPAPLRIGQVHQADGFSIALASAHVGNPQGKDMFDRVGTFENELLSLKFDIVNTDDRKILRFKDNLFTNRFSLRDDVGNEIRGSNGSPTVKIVGALTGKEDILPGTAATHVQIFAVPPPKTEYLVLSVDLEALGGEGIVEFKILAGEIDKPAN